ncbi:general substrate transporter [Aspergillus terreus]|uniref:General substrate transporter n=1 Tax=Aspergillus terreus TaxID=33178 RepID=A0A5M3YLU3_ASPTE|nr:hypothetical protein ATETN484_0001053900 [Aspergillus terreus]GFF12395.1 general substrate transporter [Aspergillus terreus]
MGGFRAVEDRPTPKEVYNWRLFSEAAIIGTGSLLFGYDSAFVGTTIARQSFEDDFGISESNANYISSNITSTFQAAAFFGAIFCFLTTEVVGRKWALQISNLVFLIGAILMTVATHQLSYIYAGRALTGLACGFITATVPSYIAELSVSSIRGILTGLFEIAYQIGSVIGFWINYGIDETLNPTASTGWRIPMAVQIIPSAILLFGGFFLHESPLWLFRKGKDERGTDALEELRHLRRDHQYIAEDIAIIKDRLREEEAIANEYGTGPLAYSRGALHELSPINYYSPTLFKSIGIQDVTLYTGIYGLVKAIASIIFYIFLIDVWGRRSPTILSSVACSLCLWFIGAYVKIGHPADILKGGGKLSSSTAAGGKAATAMIMIYSVFWSFGLNGIPWIVSAEIFPGALRNLSGTWAALCQWLIQFVITKALPYIFSSFGYGTWFFFATWMILASVWAFFFLPETKGKTLEDLDIVL